MPVRALSQNELKQQAAWKAVEYVSSGERTLCMKTSFFYNTTNNKLAVGRPSIALACCTKAAGESLWRRHRS